MLSYFGAEAIACAHFLLAHWQATGFVLIVILSALNKLLPGHPRYSGFVRLLVSLLAASPMAGARSAVFFAIAGKLGEGPAAAFFHWLSTWLDIPLLSVSVSSPGGQPKASIGGTLSVVALCIVGFGLGVGCALFKPSLAADEVACAKAAVTAIKAQVAQILLAGSSNYVRDLELLAARVGSATVNCAVQAAVADFNGFEPLLPDAGAGPGALVELPDYAGAAARGRVYLALH